MPEKRLWSSSTKNDCYYLFVVILWIKRGISCRQRGGDGEYIIKIHKDFMSWLFVPFDLVLWRTYKKQNRQAYWGTGVQIGNDRSAPLFYTTLFYQSRYQKIVPLEEWWCFFCEIFLPFFHNGANLYIFSVLHKRFTAFAYRIRDPPSEVWFRYQISFIRRSAIWQKRKGT